MKVQALQANIACCQLHNVSLLYRKKGNCSVGHLPATNCFGNWLAPFVRATTLIIVLPGICSWGKITSFYTMCVTLCQARYMFIRQNNVFLYNVCYIMPSPDNLEHSFSSTSFIFQIAISDKKLCNCIYIVIDVDGTCTCIYHVYFHWLLHYFDFL